MDGPPDPATEARWLQQVRTTFDRPLTAGNLGDYSLCPRKLLLSLFAQADQRRALGASRALHGAIRAALVAADRQGGPAAVTLEWMRGELLRRFDRTACADSLEEEQTQKAGVRILAEWQAAARDHEDALVGADVRYEAAFEDLPFSAVADRVERRCDGRLVVARYDVTLRPPGPRKLLTDFSMGLLVGVAEAAIGETPLGRLYGLRVGKTYEAEYDEARLEAVRRRAMTVARAVRADLAYEPRLGDHCRWCRVRASCSAWQERRASMLQAGGW
jgi:CRISPR/Cas system-associated exonuclease Cas4 (RecB family)